jgi:hypothetical protein
MSEVSLCRIEELLLGSSHELRPTFAVGDPTILSVAEGHMSPVRDAATGAARRGTAVLMVRDPR